MMINYQAGWIDRQDDYLNAQAIRPRDNTGLLEQQCNWLSVYLQTRQHILVVDDLSGPRTALVRDLKRAGFRVSTATSGPEALRLMASEGAPHLIISDVMTPEMDGFTFATEVQQQGDTPIVFLSTLTDTDIKIEAITRFAEDYVAMPYDPAVLVARIRRILVAYN